MSVTKATIDDIEVAGRRVLMRVDFNVPIRDGAVADDRRIRAALPSIAALRERGARLILVTHLGRPHGHADPALSVAPLARRLGDLIGTAVPLATDVVGPSAQALSAGLRPGEVGMVENVRFEPGEESNDDLLAHGLAALADVYVNDAFGTAHRAHASTEGVAHLLPAVAGRLMARELQVLGGVLHKPAPPVVAILGGAKVASKLAVLTSLAQRVDDLFIGGAMACTFFRAEGLATGESLVEVDQVDVARGVIEKLRGCRCSLHLPVDVVVSPKAEADQPTSVVEVTAIPPGQMVVDIGPRTVAAIGRALGAARTAVWNGPLGIYEVEAFAQGTRAVARAMAASPALSVIGGGDLALAVEDAGVADSINFISTGGGATLEFLEGRALPGVVALRDRAQLTV